MTPTSELRSKPFRLHHLNIKGTPRMSADKVREDVETALDRGGVVTLVEFRWDYYWRILARLVKAFLPRDVRRAKGLPTWRSFPSFRKGIANPVKGGQMILWKSDRWARADKLVKRIHRGMARISEDRRIRGVLLLDRATLLGWWVLVTHYVVGGDNDEDGPIRRSLLGQDIDVTVRALRKVLVSGFPAALTLDGNIRLTSDAYTEFRRRVVDDFGGQIHGKPGVEWIITYPGTNGTELDVSDEWETGTGRLNTDHEGRGITATLVAKKPAA